MQYGHIYAAICIMIKLKVMFWKLYTRIYFNVGTFKSCSPNSIVVKFVQEALVGDNIKGLTKIQDNNICLCLAFKILNKFISCNQKLAFA